MILYETSMVHSETCAAVVSNINAEVANRKAAIATATTNMETITLRNVNKFKSELRTLISDFECEGVLWTSSGTCVCVTCQWVGEHILW